MAKTGRPQRHIPNERLLNLRDLGGWPTEDGGCTRFGVFYRSDVPAELLGEDIALLEGLGITTVIDLRSPSELERRPNSLVGRPGIAYHNYSFPGMEGIPPTVEDISKGYFGMTAQAASIKGIFSVLAAAQGAVLFHCAAGKDRTGVVAALLLRLVGVSVTDTLADYQMTYTFIRQRIRQWLVEYPQLPAHAGRSDMEYLEDFWQLFYAEYPSVESYLLGIGLTGQQLKIIGDKLVEK